jgi:hypothetical protein
MLSGATARSFLIISVGVDVCLFVRCVVRYRYSKYIPTRAVMAKVTAFVRQHNMCNASAMHLRITGDRLSSPHIPTVSSLHTNPTFDSFICADMAQHMARKKKAVNIESYFHYVESRPPDEPVYLLTDNPESQVRHPVTLIH